MDNSSDISRASYNPNEMHFVLQFIDGIPQFKLDRSEFRRIAKTYIGTRSDKGDDHSLGEFVHALNHLMQAAPSTEATPPKQQSSTSPAADDLGQLFEKVAIEKLSTRELEVLRLVADGNSNKQIARQLAIAEPTVKCHVKSILRKLNARNRYEAAIWAVKLRLGQKL